MLSGVFGFLSQYSCCSRKNRLTNITYTSYYDYKRSLCIKMSTHASCRVHIKLRYLDMLAEAEIVNSVFDCFKPVFKDILKQLFTNQCSCEETEIHFFYIKSGPPKSFSFDGIELSDSSTEDGSEDSDSSHAFMKKYLKDNFGDVKYILESKEIERPKGQYANVHWVLLSECLDSNYGKILLKSVFQQWVSLLNSQLDLAGEAEDWASLKSDNHFYLVQSVLQNAAFKAISSLEKLFAPLHVDFISILSGEYYEKSECESNMVFLSDMAVQSLSEEDFLYHLKDIDWRVDYMEGLEFIPQNSRLIRKLLQIAQKDLYLALGKTQDGKSFKVLGICSEKMLWDKRDFPYIKVEIKRHMQWSLFLNESYIFSFKNGQNVIDRPLHEPYLVKKLTACFGEQDNRYKSLIDNIINSTGQKHGTMLVILEETEARSEAKRLGDSQYGLPEPFPREHAGEINRLNAIDGSVILDTYGKIYGIGMILDGGHPIQNELNSSEENGKGGDEIPKGNLARGARYNSGKKYYDFLRASGKKGMILIVSEDGSTDILATND